MKDKSDGPATDGPNDDSNQEAVNSEPAIHPIVRPVSAPMEVPVFNLIIYISTHSGKVKARVANLPDFSFTASSEPLALRQAITSVKERLARWRSAGESIPWVDPVSPPDENEQERLVPVHL